MGTVSGSGTSGQKRPKPAYAEPARLIDLLHTKHQIDRGALASLTPDDVEAIAAILKRSTGRGNSIIRDSAIF